jgi:hypothetical protein
MLKRWSRNPPAERHPQHRAHGLCEDAQPNATAGAQLLSFNFLKSTDLGGSVKHQMLERPHPGLDVIDKRSGSRQRIWIETGSSNEPLSHSASTCQHSLLGILNPAPLRGNGCSSGITPKHISSSFAIRRARRLDSGSDV